MNKKTPLVLLTITLLTVFYTSYAQVDDEGANEILNYCDSMLSPEVVIELKKELSELEEYFFSEKLLQSNTGQSYYNVYKKIAEEGDFTFTITKKFRIIDSLGFFLTTTCIFKLLTREEISEITPKYLEAAKNIYSSKDYNSLNVSTVAKRIIENLKPEDFDLQYFRFSSLVAFYFILKSSQSQKNIQESDSEISDQNILYITLSNSDEIIIDKNTISLEKARDIIYKFISTKPYDKTVSLTASKSATKENFVGLLGTIKNQFDKLRNELSNKIFSKGYNDLYNEEKEKIRKLVPIRINVEPSQ